MTPLPVGDAHTINDQETQILRWVNSLRGRAELVPLQMNHSLAAAARTQSYQMQQYGLHHSSWTRLRRSADFCCPGWNWVGENVAVCSRLYDCFLGWYSSPQHKREMMFAGYRVAGVGAVWDQQWFVTLQMVG